MNPMPELNSMLKQLRLSGFLESLEGRNRQAIDTKLAYNALVVQDPKTLSGDERRGCIAEIIGFRFAQLSGSESGPWEIAYGPNSSGTRVDGTEVYFPDVRTIDNEVIEYWIRRSEETPHPTLRARYADLAWEIGKFWNKANPGAPRIALDQAIARRAIDALPGGGGPGNCKRCPPGMAVPGQGPGSRVADQG